LYFFVSKEAVMTASGTNSSLDQTADGLRYS